ncbi:MAG TPA: BadF/BadG/BcrA/BcrD ATPase family protein [Chloroflexota bacterium]|nr:BadF/BadG/BcrA/BcrD ATPase family protein [Chloroflexota bacterium]
MKADLLLAIDVGQTSTKAVLACDDGRIVSRGQGGPADHFNVRGGFERNRAAIQDAIRSACDHAGVAPAVVAATALGVTGVHRGSPEIRLVEDIVREVAPSGAIAVFPDYVMNLAGASAGSWGIAVIAGGGSIAYGVSRDRSKEGIAGGYGYLLDDEGSAFDIGRRAVKAAIWASDGRGEPTILERMIREELSLAAMPEIKRVVYHANFSRDQISRLAPKVVTAAADGDRAAQSILDAAAHELARLVLAVARQIADGGETIPVYATGGVFAAGDPILTPFAADLRATWPAADIRKPTFPPVIGSLIEAKKLSGGTVGPDWLEAVRSTLTR